MHWALTCSGLRGPTLLANMNALGRLLAPCLPTARPRRRITSKASSEPFARGNSLGWARQHKIPSGSLPPLRAPRHPTPRFRLSPLADRACTVKTKHCFEGAKPMSRIGQKKRAGRVSSCSSISAATLLVLAAATACASATTGPQHAAAHNTPRSTSMGLPSSWFCFGHLGNAREMPSSNCYPSKLQCDSAQVEYQVARTGQACAAATQAYCTTPAATNSQPTLTFAYTTQTTCFAAPNYCENHRHTQQTRGTPMSTCQLIQTKGTTAFPPL